MRTRAAAALEAGKPLTIMGVNLDGPKACVDGADADHSLRQTAPHRGKSMHPKKGPMTLPTQGAR